MVRRFISSGGAGYALVHFSSAISVAPARARRLHRLLNLLHRRHPRGHDQRLAGSCHFLNQRDVHQFERCHLVRRHVHLFQEVNRGGIERSREQIESQIVSDLLQPRMPLPRRVGLAVKFVQVAPVPERSFNAETRAGSQAIVIVSAV